MEKIIHTPISQFNCRRYFRIQTQILQKNQSQRGQAIVALVLLLPLLGLLLNYFLQYLILLQQIQSVQKECRTQAHHAQQKLIQGFNQLISLNPKALKLRERKRVALRAVKSAMSPKAKAAALAYLAFVEGQQRVLQAQQQSIILQAKSKAKMDILRFKNQSYQGTPPFAMSAKPINSSTPSYFISPNFETQQELIIPWKLTNIIGQKQEGRCGSYVKKVITGFVAKISYPDT